MTGRSSAAWGEAGSTRMELLERPEARVRATLEEAAQMTAKGLQLRPAAGGAGGGVAGGGGGDGGGSRAREWVLSLRPTGVSAETNAPWLGRPLNQEDIEAFYRQRSGLSGDEPDATKIGAADWWRENFIECVKLIIMQECGAVRSK
ncbi:hypothetical protein MNEG_8886 [Monoraphidium neglectum]|jgi:hypothetical protein|uniref:Uncharacterized protein n=1 Tax=Monoraphidium neglectum TaxID=145388 RepID=A0A0D2M6Q9_9CHLO|nr:hypothetical protein MNEG_8886 [Monoraphidium neglectum]KIY99074.1 hypothetical protein MNEG_8886 [Monoraphidium neglectum]|eukprot:XP_013898094.1 hypothetical protein MNEG_8886 [Monoraphidium neglectum]